MHDWENKRPGCLKRLRRVETTKSKSMTKTTKSKTQSRCLSKRQRRLQISVQLEVAKVQPARAKVMQGTVGAGCGRARRLQIF